MTENNGLDQEELKYDEWLGYTVSSLENAIEATKKRKVFATEDKEIRFLDIALFCLDYLNEFIKKGKNEMY